MVEVDCMSCLLYTIYLYILLGCVDQKEKLVTLDMPGFSSQRYYTTPQWIGLECIMEGPNGSWSTSSSKRRSSKQFWSGDRHFTAKQRKTFILPVCACMCEHTSNILHDFKCYKRLREKQTHINKEAQTAAMASWELAELWPGRRGHRKWRWWPLHGIIAPCAAKKWIFPKMHL